MIHKVKNYQNGYNKTLAKFGYCGNIKTKQNSRNQSKNIIEKSFRNQSNNDKLRQYQKQQENLEDKYLKILQSNHLNNIRNFSKDRSFKNQKDIIIQNQNLRNRSNTNNVKKIDIQYLSFKQQINCRSSFNLSKKGVYEDQIYNQNVTAIQPVQVQPVQLIQLQQTQTSKNKLTTIQPIVFDNIKLSQFRIENDLGKGSYAVVKLGVNKQTGLEVALKIYQKFILSDSQKMKNLQREIMILKSLSHKNIIQLLNVFEDRISIVLVMEFPCKQSIQSCLRHQTHRCLTENDAKILFYQIVQGVHYMHSMNIVHRDLKLDNLLVDSNQQVKIIDFGFAIQVPQNRKLKIFCGTPTYMSPEIVLKIEYYGQKADI